MQQVKDDPRFEEFHSWADSWLGKIGAAPLPGFVPPIITKPFIGEWNPTKEIEVVGEISDEFRKKIEEVLHSIPFDLQRAMYDSGYRVVIGERVTQIFPYLKGVHPRGWPAGTTWDSSDGIFEHNKVVVTETMRPIGSKNYVKSQRSEGVLRHEYGHAVDNFLASQGKINSSSPEFITAYKQDIKQLLTGQRYEVKYYLQPGIVGRRECFAEMFGEIMGGGAHDYGHIIQKIFPRVREIIMKSIGG